MKYESQLFAAVCLMFGLAFTGRADVYPDTTGELFTTGAQQLDITSVTVTSNTTNIFFTINLAGNPQATNWGSYAIALDTGAGGATNGNGSGAAISFPPGIKYWVNCLGWGSPQLWQYNSGTAAWTNLGGATFANTTNSVSLAVSYASVGLTNGQSFKFDAYTFSGTGGAVDDLANPAEASTYWSIPYTNSLMEIYPNPAPSYVYYDKTNDLFTTGAPQLDIASVAVSAANSSMITFTINVVGNPAATNSGSYAIALDTGAGGATNGNGSSAAISLTKGINYWVNCYGWGSPQLWQYNSGTATWTNIGGVTFANSSNSVSLTLPYASVGLTAGQPFKFDAYTFSGTGGAVDDLANPAEASTYYNVPYTNGLALGYPVAVYTDTASDTFLSGSPELDITSAGVWNDGTNLSFIINVSGIPANNSGVGEYAVALVTAPGGATSGNGTTTNTSLTEGMNYWIFSYAYGGPQLWQYNSNSATWSNIGGASLATSIHSVTLTVPFANLGLTAGQTIQFDAYTFEYGSPAIDDLANPAETINWWSVPAYTNSLVRNYTLTGGSTAAPAPVIQLSWAGTQLYLTAATVTGVSYILESTASLNPASWSPVSTNGGNGGVITNTVTVNPTAGPAYYRYLVK